jgi:hypothetical protein
MDAETNKCKLTMRKLITLIIIIVLAINSQGQNIDSIIGKYYVIDIRTDLMSSTIQHTDTSSYFINVVKYNDTLIAMSFFAALDTVKATVISDSIYIFFQTLYYNEFNNFTFHGGGRIYGDTLKYLYTNISTRGAFEGNCIAIKVKENSIDNLIEKKKNLISLFSSGNGLLQLRLKSSISGEIILYTPEGKQVLKEPVKEMESPICAPSSGLLLYRFVTEKGKVQAGKVVVR